MNRCEKVIGYLLAIGICWLGGCYEDRVNNILIDEEAPAIRLINPDSSSILSRSGDSLKMIFQLADNKGLSEITITRTATTANDQFLELDSLIISEPLFGKVLTYNFNTKLPLYPDFSRLTYHVNVLDQIGRFDTISIGVRLLKEVTQGNNRFRINQYNQKRLYSARSDSVSGYNLTTQRFFLLPFTNVLDVDIAEQSEGEIFEAKLGSPNNDHFAQKEIFVLLDSTQINFNEATYDIIHQAFLTSASRYETTPELEVGDKLIVSLIKAPRPQYALITIKRKVDDLGSQDDYLEFDYKVSSE